MWKYIGGVDCYIRLKYMGGGKFLRCYGGVNVRE